MTRTKHAVTNCDWLNRRVIERVTEKVTIKVTERVTDKQRIILEEIRKDRFITAKHLAVIVGKSYAGFGQPRSSSVKKVIKPRRKIGFRREVDS